MLLLLHLLVQRLELDTLIGRQHPIHPIQHQRPGAAERATRRLDAIDLLNHLCLRCGAVGDEPGELRVETVEIPFAPLERRPAALEDAFEAGLLLGREREFTDELLRLPPFEFRGTRRRRSCEHRGQQEGSGPGTAPPAPPAERSPSFRTTLLLFRLFTQPVGQSSYGLPRHGIHHVPGDFCKRHQHERPASKPRMWHHQAGFVNHRAAVENQVEIERACGIRRRPGPAMGPFDGEQLLEQSTRRERRRPDGGSVQIPGLGFDDANGRRLDEGRKRQAIDEVDECVGGATGAMLRDRRDCCRARRRRGSQSPSQRELPTDPRFPAPTVLLPSRSSVPSDACSKNRTCSATSPSIRRNIV